MCKLCSLGLCIIAAACTRVGLLSTPPLAKHCRLVILLATATFVAFIQPPGGYNKANQVLTSSLTSCGLGQPAPGPDDGGTFSGLPTAYQECALLLFFVFDSLSFSASLGCIMMIVVISMPRLPHENKVQEAGRFWWLLLLTWGLLYVAVASGYVSFVLSAVAMYGQAARMLTGPLAIGGALLALGLVLMMMRFKDISPGGESLLRGFFVVSGVACCTQTACWDCFLNSLMWFGAHACTYRCDRFRGECSQYHRSEIKVDDDVEMGRGEAVELLTRAIRDAAGQLRTNQQAQPPAMQAPLPYSGPTRANSH